MEELMEILEEICPEVDFETEKALVDDKVLSSFDILSIVSEISEAFDVKITTAEVIPQNFNSAESLWKMIQDLRKRQGK